jgi:hypothetical protein
MKIYKLNGIRIPANLVGKIDNNGNVDEAELERLYSVRHTASYKNNTDTAIRLERELNKKLSKYRVNSCIVECYKDIINGQEYLCVINGMTGREKILLEQLASRGYKHGNNWVIAYGSFNKWDQIEVLGEDVQAFFNGDALIEVRDSIN